MACGAAVVSARIPTSVEILGKNALYYDVESPEDLAEKLDLIKTNQELLADLKQKSLKYVSMFSWKKAASQTVMVYHKILNRNIAKQ